MEISNERERKLKFLKDALTRFQLRKDKEAIEHDEKA